MSSNSSVPKGESVDVSSVTTNSKRGVWPRAALAPHIGLAEWIRPTDHTRQVRTALHQIATASGVRKPHDFAVFVNATLQSMIAPRPDPLSDDMWLFPDETLRASEGDCEDYAFLLASILLSGEDHANTLVCLGEVSFGKESFPHAWVQVSNPDGTLLALDYPTDQVPEEVSYKAYMAFGPHEGFKYVSDPIEAVLGRSYSWRWRPPVWHPPSIPNPIEAAKKKLQGVANGLAVNYKNARGGGGGFDDCVTIVAAGTAAYGASQGGVVGAAIGAGGGVPMARIACRAVYP